MVISTTALWLSLHLIYVNTADLPPNHDLPYGLPLGNLLYSATDVVDSYSDPVTQPLYGATCILSLLFLFRISLFFLIWY